MTRLPDARLAPHPQGALNLVGSVQDVANTHMRRLPVDLPAYCIACRQEMAQKHRRSRPKVHGFSVFVIWYIKVASLTASLLTLTLQGAGRKKEASLSMG